MKLSTREHARLMNARLALLRWFAKNGRPFYWRDDEREPYKVMVSEFMLQQTQASRVREYLPKFLRQFPTPMKLANAQRSDIIRAWQGLGYNRRALNLQRSAMIIVNQHKGIFPQDEKTLLGLPGVGLYTARAIQAFAYNKAVSVVDVNIERIISRLTKRMYSTSDVLPTDDIHSVNLQIMPKRSSRIWHESLMDIGSTVCTKRNPKCRVCPLKTFCASSEKINVSKHTIKRANEQLYHGKPRRIWRGMILKLIASSNGVSLSSITQHVKTKVIIKNEDISIFIEDVLKELVAEGFCAVRNKIYRLAK